MPDFGTRANVVDGGGKWSMVGDSGGRRSSHVAANAEVPDAIHGHLHRPKLDEKGRLFLPAKFRDRLAEGLVVTQGQENCLVVWPPEVFEQEAARAHGRPMTSKAGRGLHPHVLLGRRRRGPRQAGPDQHPAGLRELRRLERDVVVIGVLDRLEIWDPASGGTTRPPRRSSSPTWTRTTSSPTFQHHRQYQSTTPQRIRRTRSPARSRTIWGNFPGTRRSPLPDTRAGAGGDLALRIPHHAAATSASRRRQGSNHEHRTQPPTWRRPDPASAAGPPPGPRRRGADGVLGRLLGFAAAPALACLGRQG